MTIKIAWRTVSDGIENCFASAQVGTSQRPEWLVGIGKSEAEAIGNLILDDSAGFSIEIEREGEAA